jgi:NADH-quinone oxidoreductase subunit G
LNTQRNVSQLESALFEFKGINSKESFVNDYSNHNGELQNYWGSIERQQTNTSLCDLEASDLCLLIGVNPRYENSLYNIHLRKRSRLGGFTVASIGAPTDLTYPVHHLGLGTETLKDLVSEKHTFFKEMKNAKNPVIILGDQLKKNPDFPLVESLSLTLASKVGAVSKSDRSGFNVLNSSMSTFSKVVSGLANLNSLPKRESSRLIF